MPTIFSHLPRVEYEGPESTGPYTYRVYDKDRLVLGRRMEDWLRVAVCYWHSFSAQGADTFGHPTWRRPWPAVCENQKEALERLEAAFDFLWRLGTPYYTFHDLDVMATPRDMGSYVRNLHFMEEQLAAKMEETGVRLLWATANLFSLPHYAGGAATSPDPEVTACAAAQVRYCMEAAHRLGAENFVIWGGREGYDTLLNTDLRHELECYGRFLSMVIEHKHKIGFQGPILVEPKPFEPVKCQYDRDVSAVYAFLQRYDLLADVRVNIEVNHAQLAGLDFEHEMALAFTYGIFGSLDINRGDPRLGWDTDQFPINSQDLVPAMLQLIEHGGFETGGFNFDAKLRRQSVDPEDLLAAHVAGIDTLAHALLIAASLVEQGELARLRSTRYEKWKTHPLGAQIMAGKASLADAAEHAVRVNRFPEPQSGRQEMAESIVARAYWRGQTPS